MFCPACGAKNEIERAKCFVCERALPSAQAVPSAASEPRRPRAPQRPAAIAGAVGDRMLALLFDRVLLGAIALIVAAWLASIWRGGAPLSPPALWILGALALALLAFVYHTVAEATAGTTLGKAILGLYVRNEGDRGRLAAAALRNALRLADGVGLYLVGLLVALFAPRHRRIGDWVGGTVVLHDEVPAVARAVLLATFAALVGSALWIAAAICPECASALRDGVASGAVEVARR